MTTTDAQRQAVEAGGNVLVAAGAGAGKTSTLVARVLRLLGEGVSLQNILMVTFTEAAAAEMRGRIRKALEDARSAECETRKDETGSALEEQIALLDTAPISTLHGFCLQLVRRNFHQLDLDPQLSVLDEAQGAVLLEETLDELLRHHYSGEGALGGALEELILTHAGGREEPARELVLKIHRYTQTLPNPGAWLDAQLSVFRAREPGAWRVWLLEALHQWRVEWPGRLRAQPVENKSAREIAGVIESLGAGSSREDFATVLEKIPAAKDLKPAQRHPADFFEETKFLRELTLVGEKGDPLAQDWDWSRAGMETLLLLAREFAARFAAAKREQAALDFNDLEQFALRLLWDGTADAPTALGRACRESFEHVFVDECQDINAVQDAIIRAVSRTAPGNRFLVGDVKQSIYRFRLADPRIFQNYTAVWRDGAGARVIELSDNFRSREALLDFFNAVFADLMRPEVGRVQFDEAARLQFGAREQRRALSLSESPGPRVHLHLRLTEKADEPALEGGADVAELTDAEHEARLVAHRLRELRGQGHLVAKAQGLVPVDWGDMAVLLRAPGAKAEIYAREFARQNIPLEVASGNFFDALEVADLLNVLLLLDNPLQDVPLLAVLHSPLVGLTADDLATIRLAQRGGYFWTALNAFHAAGRAEPAWPKVEQFLERFARWRSMGRDSSIGQRLETILAETHYQEWLAASAANPQRAAQREFNVRRLLTLARRFDPFQRQGVPRFLRFVEAQRAVVAREPLAGSGRAVQLFSIHRSKGLEYPVVVVPDLGKRFHLDDLRADVLLHERFGPCPRIKPPHTGQRYPSLTHWLYTRDERRELLGEEMRLLYVALTRARDTLLLVGTATRKRAGDKWAEDNSSPAKLLAAGSMLDWLGPWFTRRAGAGNWLDLPAGANELFSWRVYSGEEATGSDAAGEAPASAAPAWANLARSSPGLVWKYPFESATREAAKTSVSVLRRKLAEAAEEARPWWRVRAEKARPVEGLSAADIGTAHHTFLEFADLARLPTGAGVAAEAERLVAAGVLSAEEAGQLNRAALAGFWSSREGARLLGALPDLRRELPFTARLTTARLVELGLSADPWSSEEFVVVQGVVDLAVIRPKEIWIVDFKTDDVARAALPARVELYTPQLRLYAASLALIYARPVTWLALHFLSAGETSPISVN